MKILASDNCPASSVSEIRSMVEDFRTSPCAHFTHQHRISQPDAPMYLDFPKEQIMEVLNQGNCQGLRIYFAAQNGDLTKGGNLTLLGVGYEPVELDGEVPEITFLRDLIDTQNIELNDVICCIHNPPPPPPDNNIFGVNFV